MKILFTADWHLKLKQKNVPVVWAKERYASLFEQVNNIKADIHVVGGDILDRAPSLEELELLFNFIEGATIPTIIYDGNHEATRKGKTFLTSLQKVTKVINPLVSIITEVTEYPWGTVVPYCRLKDKNVFEGLNSVKPLFTHVRGEIPPHVKPEIDLNLLKRFPIVYAGDLHAHCNTQLNIVYPGSPVTTSFHRTEVDTGYLLINSDDNTWIWEQFSLPQLIRKTIEDPNLMVPTEYNHTIYDIEGDLANLSKVKDSDLLDKKIIKKNTEATLILSKSMSITDELVEYLRYILELPEDVISEVVGGFNDTVK